MERSPERKSKRYVLWFLANVDEHMTHVPTYLTETAATLPGGAEAQEDEQHGHTPADGAGAAEDAGGHEAALRRAVRVLDRAVRCQQGAGASRKAGEEGEVDATTTTHNNKGEQMQKGYKVK